MSASQLRRRKPVQTRYVAQVTIVVFSNDKGAGGAERSVHVAGRVRHLDEPTARIGVTRC